MLGELIKVLWKRWEIIFKLPAYKSGCQIPNHPDLPENELMYAQIAATVEQEAHNERRTYEEWDLFERVKYLPTEEAADIIVRFYEKRIKAIFESDGLLPFEQAKEYSHGEYLRIRYFSGN